MICQGDLFHMSVALQKRSGQKRYMIEFEEHFTCNDFSGRMNWGVFYMLDSTRTKDNAEWRKDGDFIWKRLIGSVVHYLFVCRMYSDVLCLLLLRHIRVGEFFSLSIREYGAYFLYERYNYIHILDMVSVCCGE
jgi:hypothetical protein